MNVARIITAQKRAVVATLFFVLCGLFAMSTIGNAWGVAWPLVVFYFLLVLNTYFSIRYFSIIISPVIPSQIAVDTVLTVFTLLLLTALKDPLSFNVILTALFATAVLKYVIAIPVTEYPVLLHRKIRVDALGVLASSLATFGVASGHATTTVLVWAAIFAGANIHVILLRPLYPAPTIRFPKMVEEEHARR